MKTKFTIKDPCKEKLIKFNNTSKINIKKINIRHKIFTIKIILSEIPIFGSDFVFIYTILQIEDTN